MLAGIPDIVVGLIGIPVALAIQGVARSLFENVDHLYSNNMPVVSYLQPLMQTAVVIFIFIGFYISYSYVTIIVLSYECDSPKRDILHIIILFGSIFLIASIILMSHFMFRGIDDRVVKNIFVLPFLVILIVYTAMFLVDIHELRNEKTAKRHIRYVLLLLTYSFASYGGWHYLMA